MSCTSATSPRLAPTKQPPTDAAPRRELGPRASIAVLASMLVSFLGSSSAPTPLYAVYQQHWGFSPITTTIVFGVYALAVLSSLLISGRVSDQVGRRPVLLTALIVQVVAMVVFIAADSVGALLAGRVLQGLSAGVAVGAIGAGMLDIDARKGGFLNSFAPLMGTVAGVLASGLIVRYLPAPTRLVYAILLGIFVLQALAVLALKETVSRRPGALAGMVPEFKLPRSARPAIAIAAPLMFAVWALSGLYGAFGPAIMRTLLHSTSVLWGGLPLFVLAAAAGLAVVLLRGARKQVMLRTSISTLVVGVLITLLSIASGDGGTLSAIGFFVGAAISGVGFGAGFQGGIRLVVPQARSHERAGVLSLLYVVCYVGLGVPAVIAGMLVVYGGGLVRTSEEYGIAVIVLALVALTVLVLSGRRAERRPVSPGYQESAVQVSEG
ncbi:MFS transporter [Nonomuraea maheshkhaliensis]|uniref:MFS transporter n=1 Tax=Nonomuraea maheshkhaliensis TaxID=419590 RepID=A0ABN2EZW2_9ACTN